MTEKLFAALEVYRSDAPQSAAMNMAIDEALLELATFPTVRFYTWDHPALSFGYFGKLSDVASYSDRDCVRRWTGGGIVLHGEDLTYSLVIPSSDPAFSESTMSIYEKVHAAIRDALGESGTHAGLSSVAGPPWRGRNQQTSAVRDRRYSSGITDPGYNENSCFANPVRADVMLNGQKIAGAAQRKTRRGLLQQGSIQNTKLPPDFEINFASSLSNDVRERAIEPALLARAQEISAQKYGTDSWLHRR